MIILANGAYKSGSTWVKCIAQELLPITPLPDQYQESSVGKSVDLGRLSDLIEWARQSPETAYLSKVHFYDHANMELVVGNPDAIKVLFISRNLDDALVSHYHHFMKQWFKMPFSLYYVLVGRWKAMEITKYNRTWLQSEAENICAVTFEDLKADFENVVIKIAEFLGVTPTDEIIGRVRDGTNIDLLRSQSGESGVRPWFFRAGRVGDGAQYVRGFLRRDVQRIERNRVALWENIAFMGMKWLWRDVFTATIKRLGLEGAIYRHAQ